MPTRRSIRGRTSAAVAGVLIVSAVPSLLLTACDHQQKTAVRDSEADTLKALSVHTAELAHAGLFSGAVLVARHDRVLFSHAYGLADRERRIPNTVRTRFRIGSMNKMFTAVAILQLVEAGKVKLTAPLGTYLPDYPNREVATKVTIHQLLTHTGGTGDIFGPDFDAHRNELRTLDDYVRLYGKRGLEFEPGSDWAYSNYGFLLLGVGDREGDRAELLRLRAAARLRARGDDPQRIAARNPSGPGPVDRVHPATRSPAWAPNTDTLPYRGTSAGGGYSTVEDLARFARRAARPQTTQPRRHQAADHRESGLDELGSIRVRLRRCSSPRRKRLGRSRRRRTGHERGSEDVPRVRLRGRGAGKPRSADGTAAHGLSRLPAAHDAIKPSPNSCCALAEMAAGAAECDDVGTHAPRVTDAVADIGTQP